jgi:hypothetical protein
MTRIQLHAAFISFYVLMYKQPIQSHVKRIIEHSLWKLILTATLTVDWSLSLASKGMQSQFETHTTMTLIHSLRIISKYQMKRSQYGEGREKVRELTELASVDSSDKQTLNKKQTTEQQQITHKPSIKRIKEPKAHRRRV